MLLDVHSTDLALHSNDLLLLMRIGNPVLPKDFNPPGVRQCGVSGSRRPRDPH
jgi:hypothetical protein